MEMGIFDYLLVQLISQNFSGNGREDFLCCQRYIQTTGLLYTDKWEINTLD